MALRLLALPPATDAQPPGKVYRVGVLAVLANIRKRGILNRPAERHDQADVFEGRRVASAARRR